jgi:hypothetical protein
MKTMKRFLLLLPFFLIGCTVSQKVVYKTDDISASQTTKTIPMKVEIRVLNDNRANINENSILFTNSKQTKLEGKSYFINAEKNYQKDSVASQITRLMVEHFNKAKLFEMTFYGQSNYSDYYITGTLNSFYGEQQYSSAAAVGSQFGLIGALATANVKTPGKIIIDISDLKLFKKDGTLIKDFGSFYKEYKDDFKADAYGWCIYGNVNEKLKDFNTHLIEKIRTDIAETN